MLGQVDADQAALSLHVAARSHRFLWTGLGFAVFTVIGVSSCALHPLSWHAPAEPPRLVPEGAFNPIAVLGPTRGMHSKTHTGFGNTRPTAVSPAVLPGGSKSRPASLPVLMLEKWDGSLAGSEIDINDVASSEDCPVVDKIIADEMWDQAVADAGQSGAVLVAFFGVKSCRKCRAMKPKFEEMANTHCKKDVMWVDVNAARLTKEKRAEINLVNVPAFQIWSQGNPLEQFPADKNVMGTFTKLAGMVERYARDVVLVN